jgi:hypothetical protein
MNGIKMKPVIIIAIAFVLLIPIAVFAQSEREWISSGPFQIDRSEYAIGESIFIKMSEIEIDEKGEIVIYRPLNATHHKLYLTIPFDGADKPTSNTYFTPQISADRGIYSTDDLVGEWLVVFRDTNYQNLEFKITEKNIPGTNTEPEFYYESNMDSLLPNSEYLSEKWKIMEIQYDVGEKGVVNFVGRNYEEKDIFPHNVKLGIMEFQTHSSAVNEFENFISYYEENEKSEIDIPFETCFGTWHSKSNVKFFADFACIKENYIIIVNTETQTYEAEDLAKDFLLLTLDKFPLTSQQIEEQQKLQDQANEIKMKVDEGEILDYMNSEVSINEIKIIKKDKKDLLVINFQWTPTTSQSIANNQIGNSFKTLKAAQDWDSNYESFSNLITEEYTILGTTIPASDDWSEKCPVYIGKTVNPRISTDLIACFEIPKDVTIFSFEEIQFSRSANVKETNTSSSEQSTITSSEQKTSNSGGGCLIATATYGSELAPEVQKLRELRDNSLLSTESGTNFINSFNDVYYSFSPIIADYERENPIFREMVKVVITPMISSLSILNYVDMDSESSVLGYGISLILLNVGMYIGIPIFAIIRIRK